MDQPLYPLRFRPCFRRAVWGGRRLATLLQKPIGSELDYAESWEVVDHGDDQSVVAEGAYCGHTLHELIQSKGPDILGIHDSYQSFPLLFKFLDAHQPLSVQVHPNDEQAAQLDKPDLGKTEAWVILHAEPGSVLYAGLKRGFDRRSLEREVRRGTTELCLNRITPQTGDCFFIPAGVVHALGAGIVVAEIQQASDTTFRLFDWNRTGSDGRPRVLHVEQSLETINYDYGPVSAQQPQPTDNPRVQELVACDKFVLRRWQWHDRQTIGGDQRCRILAVLAGELRIERDPCPTPLRTGATALLPATIGPLELAPSGPVTMLEMTCGLL